MYDDVYEDETQVIEPRDEKRPERRRPDGPPPAGETRPFWLASELWAVVALIAAAAVAALTTDGVDAQAFWLVAAAAVVAYVLSRGLAKSGTPAATWDPRERLLERLRSRR